MALLRSYNILEMGIFTMPSNVYDIVTNYTWLDDKANNSSQTKNWFQDLLLFDQQIKNRIETLLYLEHCVCIRIEHIAFLKPLLKRWAIMKIQTNNTTLHCILFMMFTIYALQQCAKKPTCFLAPDIYPFILIKPLINWNTLSFN